MKLSSLQKLLLTIGLTLVIIAGGIMLTIGYFNSKQRTVPIVFSNNAMLLETWNAYKRNIIQPSSGRTVDKTQDNLTTSEGESYTMLRAVWMDDRATFDKSWSFTKGNLQRPDHLFSWKYGSLGNGKYGILTSAGGQNTASDADQDIALSLLMAYNRWNDSSYLRAAQPIVTSIWEKEVVMIQNKPVLTADDLERNATQNVVVNPSYFGFANYRVFAALDPSHDWAGLTANSYSLLDQLSTAPLDKTKSSGLPPNWIQINRKTGDFVPATTQNLDTNFGYDAIRIPFRLALDYAWFKDGRDKQSLSHFGFLESFWKNVGLLNTIYTHDGTAVETRESPATYGATIGYFTVMNPGSAAEIYKSKLQTLYSPDEESWKTPAPSYYEDNWAWFGIALTQNALPNLTEK